MKVYICKLSEDPNTYSDAKSVIKKVFGNEVDATNWVSDMNAKICLNQADIAEFYYENEELAYYFEKKFEEEIGCRTPATANVETYDVE